jgi:hypothetical protein
LLGLAALFLGVRMPLVWALLAGSERLDHGDRRRPRFTIMCLVSRNAAGKTLFNLCRIINALNGTVISTGKADHFQKMLTSACKRRRMY